MPVGHGVGGSFSTPEKKKKKKKRKNGKQKLRAPIFPHCAVMGFPTSVRREKCLLSILMGLVPPTTANREIFSRVVGSQSESY
jgi:hypothetical protein